MKTLEKRLELANSDRPFIPRLSPKDFAIGQIGEFDDDLILQMSKPGKEEARISVMFDELKFFDETARVPWVHVRIGRPDSFYLRGDIVAPLVNVERGGDRNSPTHRLLHKHVFEIVDKIPRGLIADFVLVPYPMNEVQAWLKDEDARRPKKP